MQPSEHSNALAYAAAQRVSNDVATLRQYFQPEHVDNVRDLSVGRLLASLASPSGPLTKEVAPAEWKRCRRNAEELSPDLTGPGRFYAHPSSSSDALIDWAWLRSMATRAMATTPGSKGGYMSAGTVFMPADALWGDSVIARAGVPTVTGLVDASVQVPRATAITTSWVAEGSAPSAVDETVGATSATAKTVIALVTVSLQLLRQAQSFQDFIGGLLIRSVQQALDKALLQGAGGAEPLGLANLPATTGGLQTVSGTSLALAGILSAERKAIANGATNLTWVGDAATKETLSQRERVSGNGGFLWDNGQIAGETAISTPDAASTTLIVGDWTRCALLLWGPGLEIAVDRSGTNFNTGSVTFRVMAMADVVCTAPQAFVRIGSIT